MCPAEEGVSVEIYAQTPSMLLSTQRHFCLPKTQTEEKAMVQAAFWGAAAGLMLHVPSGTPFTLSIYAKDVRFTPGGDIVWEELPEDHPLRVYRNVFRWKAETRR